MKVIIMILCIIILVSYSFFTVFIGSESPEPNMIKFNCINDCYPITSTEYYLKSDTNTFAYRYLRLSDTWGPFYIQLVPSKDGILMEARSSGTYTLTETAAMNLFNKYNMEFPFYIINDAYEDYLDNLIRTHTAEQLVNKQYSLSTSYRAYAGITTSLDDSLTDIRIMKKSLQQKLYPEHVINNW